jgi:hypothetical protein
VGCKGRGWGSVQATIKFFTLVKKENTKIMATTKN